MKTMVEKAYKEGDKFLNGGSYVKIMAIRDNYIMARRKGCVPFVVSEKDFTGRYIPRPLSMEVEGA